MSDALSGLEPLQPPQWLVQFPMANGLGLGRLGCVVSRMPNRNGRTKKDLVIYNQSWMGITSEAYANVPRTGERVRHGGSFSNH